MEPPLLQYSLHLDCKIRSERSKKKGGNTDLCPFGCTIGESKPENERERGRGRTAAAFGAKLVRGMTFRLEVEVDAWRSVGGRSPP